MAKRKPTPRNFFEPWVANKSLSHGKEPATDGIPDEVRASISDAWHRSDRDADWILWGSGMAEPAIAVGFASGKPAVMDDRRIIAIRRTTGLAEGSVNNEEIAKRIAECVTALAGVADPVAFVEDVRALLRVYALGTDIPDATEDLRFMRLWMQCVPLEEGAGHGHGEDE